jgi:arsenate reductase
MKELPLDDFIKVDIKTDPLTENDLGELHTLSGSYEVLFSKVARLYRSMNLKEKNLKEVDFKKYLLEHYTFLKRPVFIIDNEVFIGNAKKNIELVKSKLA